MKLFLSWSGERSRGIAQTLRQTLPLLMNSAVPWMSDSDIEKGERWNSVLAGVLDCAKVGIFCLTPSNVNRPALLFEAGAISKSVSDARVCVLLDGMESQNVGWPWSQFQYTRLDDQEDMFKMLSGINKWIIEANEAALPMEQFTTVLEMWWPKLQASLKALPPDAAAPLPQRSEKDMLIEILELLRDERRRNTVETMNAETRRQPEPENMFSLLTSLGRENRAAKAAQLQTLFAEALDHAGHNTAAAQLANSTFALDDQGVCTVTVPMRKTMLALTINADAEAIMRKAANAAGIDLAQLRIVPEPAMSKS